MHFLLPIRSGLLSTLVGEKSVTQRWEVSMKIWGFFVLNSTFCSGTKLIGARKLHLLIQTGGLYYYRNCISAFYCVVFHDTIIK